MAEKQRIWAMLMRLGVNTNAKPGDCRPYEMEDEFRYHETLFYDKDTWQRVTEYLPTQGLNMVVIDICEGLILSSHPELAVEGSITKEELAAEIQRLKELGLEPIPKYNFSCAHNGWLKGYANQIGTDEYRKVCADIVKEVIELFDRPRFFHLGMDNEAIDKQKYNAVKIERSWKQKTEDAKALFDICLKEGVRPWIWLDAANVEEYGGAERFCENIPKEVLISNRSYMAVHPADKGETLPANTALYQKLAEWGYEQVPTCYKWNFPNNVIQTPRYCKEFVPEESIQGYIIASWVPTMPDYYYELLYNADLLGFAKKKTYPEDLGEAGDCHEE